MTDVYNKNGGYVRTYSEEQHGEGYHELALGYAKKIGGSLSPNVQKSPKGQVGQTETKDKSGLHQEFLTDKEVEALRKYREKVSNMVKAREARK